MRWLATVFILLSLVSVSTEAKTKRSSWQVTLFKKSNPCPVTAKTYGSCPGYVVDHIMPLCAGGADRPYNMQWQTVKDGKIKDRFEVKLCKNNK